MIIGEHIFGEYPLFLAPMENITDPSFRALCKQFGADMVYTEFVATDQLIHEARKTLSKLRITETERPIGIQLYGHILENMVASARIATRVAPNLIDLNFGCPVRKIANRGAGAGMLRTPDKMVEITRAVVEATHLPVTVKTRLGWDDDSKIIVELAERLQDTGIAALAIHGRTRQQFYSGQADWTLIGQVKNNPRMHIPIIGNGDVDSPLKAAQMFRRYGVDALMIGRAAIGRPWIFRDMANYLKNGALPNPMSIEERHDIALQHFQSSLEWKNGMQGIFEMRKQFSNYFAGLPNFKDLRYRLMTETEVDRIIDLLQQIKHQYAGFVFKSD